VSKGKAMNRDFIALFPGINGSFSFFLILPKGCEIARRSRNSSTPTTARLSAAAHQIDRHQGHL
jgi:hypothetical protein